MKCDITHLQYYYNHFDNLTSKSEKYNEYKCIRVIIKQIIKKKKIQNNLIISLVILLNVNSG